MSKDCQPGTTKKSCEPQPCFSKRVVFLLQETALAVKFHELGDVKLWFLQNLHLQQNPTPEAMTQGRFDSPDLWAKLKHGGWILVRCECQILPPKHWEVFFWSKDGVFPKTPECDVLNRTGIAGWGLWIPRFYEWFPSKKVPTDGWKPAITT